MLVLNEVSEHGFKRCIWLQRVHVLHASRQGQQSDAAHAGRVDLAIGKALDFGQDAHRITFLPVLHAEQSTDLAIDLVVCEMIVIAHGLQGIVVVLEREPADRGHVREAIGLLDEFEPEGDPVPRPFFRMQGNGIDPAVAE